MRMVSLVMIILFFPILSFADPQVVIFPKGQSEMDNRRTEVVELMRLALEKTIDTYGPFILKPSDYIANQIRQLFEIKSNINGHINVAWMDTNERAEKELLPIYIPIQKGIVGYRIFLIKSKFKENFSKDMTLDDLRKLKNGIGPGWMNEGVFKLNKLGYVSGNNYEGLFKMLDVERFDYFSRGITEAFSELALRKQLYPDMMVEKNIALYYHHPIYLFTSRQNTKLNERLTLGLNMMIADGSFDTIFCKYNKRYIEQANLKNRKIFKLDYHLQIPESVIDRKDFWYDPLTDACH